MPLTALKPSQELLAIVQILGGSWHGFHAMCRCPAHADQEPSLSLRQGDRGILVTCFAGCRPEDVLRELRRLDRSGASTPQPDFRQQNSGNAFRLWNRALPVCGTLAERYLEGRKLGSRHRDIRFDPACPLGPRPRTRYKPALLVAVREGRRLTAVQRIFLARHGDGYEVKLMLGQPGQGAWQSGEPAEILAVAEGFETAASFAKLHNIACWASLGARRLDQLSIPPRVTTLLIAEDNDSEGRRAASNALRTYERPGLTIRRVPPPPRYGDWAEVLVAER